MTAARVPFDQLRSAGVLAVAVRLGFAPIRGRTLACPACRAGARSSRGHDSRGPVGLTPDGLGWRCHRCGAAGDAVTFAALATTCTAKPGRLMLEALKRAGLAGQTASLPPPAPPRAPSRPPRRELLDLLARCEPFHEDEETASWARSRGIDPAMVADRCLAFALRGDAPAPSWARLGGRPWPVAGYRIALPLWEAQGALASCHARSVRRDAEPKGASPAGHQVAGLVLADAGAGAMLEHGTLAGELWITEGVPDFLTAATAWGDAADPAPAVLGVISGSWTAELAARIPNGARVVVAVHHDDAGARYLERIVETLGSRVTLERWTPAERNAS